MLRHFLSNLWSFNLFRPWQNNKSSIFNKGFSHHKHIFTSLRDLIKDILLRRIFLKEILRKKTGTQRDLNPWSLDHEVCDLPLCFRTTAATMTKWSLNQTMSTKISNMKYCQQGRKLQLCSNFCSLRFQSNVESEVIMKDSIRLKSFIETKQFLIRINDWWEETRVCF